MCNFAGVNELQLGCRWSQSPSEVMIELISVLEPRPFDPGKPEKTSGWKVLLDCYARAAISSMQKIVSLGFFWVPRSQANAAQGAAKLCSKVKVSG